MERTEIGEVSRAGRSGGTRASKASSKPRRIALLRRIVSLRALAAFIATHLGAELVQRHGAEHRDPLAQHPERHPHGALAAFAPDPGIAFGLELGDGSGVCHPRIKRGPCGNALVSGPVVSRRDLTFGSIRMRSVMPRSARPWVPLKGAVLAPRWCP